MVIRKEAGNRARSKAAMLVECHGLPHAQRQRRGESSTGDLTKEAFVPYILVSRADRLGFACRPP
jgi:hypothetical protein